MRKVLAIVKKELGAYFKSPIAYIVLVLTISVFNIFFFMILDENHEASLRDIFKVMEFLFVFIIPILTMKIFAEEKTSGTMELLLTTPTRISVIVFGKYLGALCFYSLIIILTFFYYAVIEYFSNPDRLAVLSGYIGIWIEGALFISIGILCSSWSRSQIVAAISSYVFIFFLYFSVAFNKYFNGVIKGVVHYIGVTSHSQDLFSGLITLGDVFYFVSGIAVCLFFTIFSVHKLRDLGDNILFFVKQRSIAGLVTVCEVISVFCLLVVGNYLVHRHDIRWDMTRAGQHTLAKETVSLLHGLKQDVKLTVFYVGVPPKYLEDMLNEYVRLSAGKVSYQIIDPLVDIGYAAQFGNIINGKESKVIVQSGKLREDIDFSNAPLSQKQLNHGIVQVTRRQVKVYFLTGHGEYSINDNSDHGLSTFAKLLKENNFVSVPLMLGISKGIPEDCDVLVIAGPSDFLSKEEENVIQSYLKKGGDALFLIEHTVITTPDKPLTEEEKKKYPSLNSILNYWGVNIGSDIVIDLSNHVGNDVGCPATRNYMPHKAIVSGLDYTFYIRPRSISILKDRRKSVLVAPLVLTASSRNSWAETNRMLKVRFDKGIDRPGPIPIAYVIAEPKSKGKKSSTRIVVFTDADFLSNAFVGDYSNAEMGLNVVKWLSEMDYNMLVDSGKIKIERLRLTSKQRFEVAIILIFMPVCICLLGGFLWVRYRR